MKRLNFLAGLILAASCLAAQQPQNDSTKGRPTNDSSTTRGADRTDSNRNAPSTTAGKGQLSNEQKAAAYDKWSDKQKMEVSKSMGHDMSKMSSAERSEAAAKMTAQDKSDAYDYYTTHNKTGTTTNP